MYTPVENPGPAAEGETLKNNARRGQAPHDAKQAPAPCAAQGDQRERRVGARDQQVDRGVIEDPEDALGAARGQRMIQRRGEVQQTRLTPNTAQETTCHAVPCTAAVTTRIRGPQR